MKVKEKHKLLILLFYSVLLFATISISYFGIYRSSSHLYENIKVLKDVRDSKCTSSLWKSKSKWFQQKGDGSIMPFWTKSNLNISRGSTQWWLKIQSSKETDTGAMMEKLHKTGMPAFFGRIFPTRNDQCVTCAVVGNSANLKHSQYGQEINNHDIVIRFNKAPTTGFEDDVGSVTTHRILYPESAIHLPINTSLVLVPFKPLDVEWLFSAITTGYITKTYTPVMDKIQCNVSKIKILHPEFLRYIHKNWLNQHGRYPSTGVIGVAMAIQLCDNVDVYGFGANNKGEWQHYWEHLQPRFSLGFRQTGVHNADAEKDFLQKLHDEGIITLHKGFSSL